MTVTMLVLGIFWGTCGALLSHELGKSFGVIGYITGYILGAFASYLFTWVFLVGRLLFFFPLPVCRQGCCQGYNNYDWPISTIHGWEGWKVYRYRCRCQDEYIRVGKKFLEVLPDKQTRPYKKLVGFRRWTDDRWRSSENGTSAESAATNFVAALLSSNRVLD